MDKMQPIDDVIESALRSEPLRDVPSGFSSRVMERIAAEAHETERATAGSQRFVRPMMVVGVLAAAMVVIPVAAYYGQWTSQALPGGMGALDYALAWVDLSRMASITDFTFAGGLILLGATGVAGAAWAFTRRRTAHSRVEQ